MKISLIVPVYNESTAIDPFLGGLAELPGDWEILFADGGSTDGTAEKIQARYTLLLCPKGRARQMNAAAEQASGEVLWFVHCDSVLPGDAYGQIAGAVRAGAVFGCFHIGFDYDGPFMRCNTYFSNRRARVGKIAFGDQGIFMTRELFFQQGGFPDLPIMEDYAFSRAMKRRHIPLTVLPGQIVTSGRRYRGEFPLVTMWRMFYLRCLYRAGVDIHEIARRYRDIR